MFARVVRNQHRMNGQQTEYKRKFDIVVACDSKGGIAKQGRIPWAGTPQASKDLEYFRKITTGDTPGRNVVIMGRRTYESLPEKYRPLPKRVNVVLSRSTNGLTVENRLTDTPLVHVNSLDNALHWCDIQDNLGAIFVIGGEQVYREAAFHPRCDRAFVTAIDGDYQCDQFFDLSYPFTKCDLSFGMFKIYAHRNDDEPNYNLLLSRLLNAPSKPNRTGIATRGLFSETLKFKLKYGDNLIMPLLTNKRVAWKSVVHELIWFLRGSVDTKYLTDNNVRIWDGNTTAEFLKSRGLNYPPGVAGPIYGYQWRSWNAPFGGPSAEGIDQLGTVIQKLKTSPEDRRLLVLAWNPEQLAQMALPPCHYGFQFVVTPSPTGAMTQLNCQMTMRSADVALGVPFNIASYALLTHMVAKITGLTPDTLSIVMADCHLYENHIDGVKTILSRHPRPFPVFKFSDAVNNKKDLNIDDFAHTFGVDDYIIENYHPHPAVKLDMAV